MTWTTGADVKSQTLKLWNRGILLSAMVNHETIFPKRLTLKGPSSAELTEQFGAVRGWIAELRRAEAEGFRIVWREVQHRVLGQNTVPGEVWIDSFEDAVSVIGKRREVDCFAAMVVDTRQRCPELVPWLARYPIKSLAIAEDWSRLLDIVSWMKSHPRPGVYLRQADVPGLDSKFIEGRYGLLSELLAVAMPDIAVQSDATGVSGFCDRYGFRTKPFRIRFRVLDPELAIFPGNSDQDVTVNHDTFAQLSLPVRHVFITENEINYLAFPPVQEGMVIFGAGYGFEMFAEARWLQSRHVGYWGDIDTHGFAILNQARSVLPGIQSILMDESTLLKNKALWTREERQHPALALPRLTNEEQSVFQALKNQRWGVNIRLEQERIPWPEASFALTGPAPASHTF